MDLRPPRREQSPRRTQSSRPWRRRSRSSDWSLDPETTLEMIETGATGSRDRDDVSYHRPLEVTRERTDVVAS